MLKHLLFIGLLLMYGTSGAAQHREVKAVTHYGEVAFSTQIWPASTTVGVQASGGIIIMERFSLGAGYGIGSRNYEYSVVPLEVGYVFLQGNLHARAYFGTTTGSYNGFRGFITGGELVFRPQFEQYSMKLFLALGLAFDKSAEEQNFSIDPNRTTVVAGPRFRLGIGI